MTPRAVIGAVAAGLVLTGCASDDAPGGADEHAHDAPADVAGSGQTFGHIHGLGLVGGELYVATHHGLFIVAEGSATRVSEDDHDFMGFTVVDDKTFLASGHPGADQPDLPGNLGLIESTDGGRTWESVSLAGEVDFHALSSRHGVVYGLDSGTGQLMFSADRENWERFDTDPMADVTISPDDGSTVIITTEAGPMLSQDGGKNFEDLAAAPVMVFVDWPNPDELYGLGVDGSVHRSADGGVTWDSGDRLGAAPQAIAAAPNGTLYVALEQSIVVSDDGGDTFAEYYAWD